MELPLEQLRTLAAVVDAGTLDKAASELGITPSAVSQRIRAIEQRIGRVVLRRTKPVTATEAGEPLVRLARQLALLEHDARVALGDEVAAPHVPLAVNADSLITWFLPALTAVTSAHEVTFEIHREDQERTAQLLAAGTVMGAVTSQREPVSGCVASPLGRMPYTAIATRAFADRWFPDGIDRASLERAPIVDFDRNDTLQSGFARRHGARSAAPRHVISASAEFAQVIVAGLGWGMLLPGQYEAGVADGSLVRLGGDAIEVPLYWQRWNLSSPLLDTVTAAVQRAAAASPALV
ncbi:LysR family transcriptional regulator ArgP [Microbacterium dauci]|uniref:LysR family transcriptional regulator ArgP n=1 Tax=Microbacterium dauci TaxID=3048008 RepID=A0ABT6ZAG6_9MICO|nr:LysR family transcriptional regulator ArgP [Microbacterium sp. LX3-4]MDJ1113153.1 LysR family transcriptional regulator ArgP [Microbacterium sp. LX3-4]